MVRERWGDDNRRAGDDAVGEVRGKRQIVAQLQVRAVFLQRGAERDHDHRVGCQDLLRLDP